MEHTREELRTARDRIDNDGLCGIGDLCECKCDDYPCVWHVANETEEWPKRSDTE